MKQAFRIVFVCLVALLAGRAAAFGDSGFLDLVSPVFLGGAGGTATEEAPMGTLLNPAASADRQRPTFDGSYIALTQVTPGFDYGGTVLNLGMALPTRAGVLSAVGRFADAGLGAATGLEWGPLGALNVSFAKDLYPDFYVGAGLGAELGSDWGLGLDLGFLSLTGDIGFLKDFRWGGAIRNIGKAYGYGSTPGSLGDPPPFTPALGASFDIVKTKDLVLSLAPDISFPAFQDARFALGASFSVANILFLSGSYTFDTREALGIEPANSLPFSLGMTLRLSGLGGKPGAQDVSEVNTTVAAAPLADGIWGFGVGVNVPVGVRNTIPPKITIDTGGTKYISPNFDGVQDDLVLPLQITDNRYVKGYRFVVTDAAGATIRTILNKEDRPENRDFPTILSRLAYLKTGITVPPTIRWDGMSDGGTVVPDGTYHYHVEAWDDNNNQSRSPDGTVIVKTVAPSVSVSAPYLIFSPDGDGTKDTLPVTQSGSTEDEWKAAIRDIQGTAIRTYDWKNSAPQSFAWDGKTDAGVLAPDGVYTYVIAATDRAGNVGSARLDNLVIDTRPTPVRLTVDLSYFSPNGDGIKDTVTFGFDVPTATGIDMWTFSIRDAQGSVQRTATGAHSIPTGFLWDGRNDAGVVLPEGRYTGHLSVVYVNGHTPDADSPVVNIKLTPPSAATKAQYDAFSPTGDSQRNTDTIYQDTSNELLWAGTFKDAAGKDVRTLVWRGRADDQFAWDGRGDDGRVLPDGEYTYTLTATDQAGNTGSSAPIAIRIDTEKKPVGVATDLVYFAPFGNGPHTRIRIAPLLAVKTGVESYSVQVRGADGTVVRSYAGRTRVPESFDWDGIDDGGNRVADGKYTALLSVLYSNGSRPTAQTTAFFVDDHVPQIDVSSDALLFSPTPDSRLPAVTIHQSSSAEDVWEGSILSADGKKVHSWYWKGNASDFAWDGKDDNGNLMPDGTYTYVVSATSKAGLVTTKEMSGIQIDSRSTPVFVTVDGDGFSPNGDGFKDTIDVSPLLTVKDGIKSWTLSMIEAAAGEQRVFTGAAPVPDTVTWDGMSSSGGTPAPDGLYTAVLTVEYVKGNVATARSTPFRLAVTPPKVDLTLDGIPFSPDNDGVNDELGINLSVDDPVTIDSWKITILDPEQHPFTTFEGKGAPSQKIIWNGTSSTGELVQSAEDYPLIFTIRDVLGNVTTVQKVIPVDVLVLKVGDKLIIRIPSITFQANTADYVNVDPDKAVKNRQTIARLVEIFKRYDKYRIQVEGHANLINYDNPARAKVEQEQELLPLSKKRADAIRDALIAGGIDAGRITTLGVGAADPVVPFSDADNRWKNRRVEFLLDRS